jgi:hypothetical protein
MSIQEIPAEWDGRRRRLLAGSALEYGKGLPREADD